MKKKPAINFFIRIIKVFVLAYLGLVGLMYFLQRKLIYLPSKFRPLIENHSETYTELKSQTKDKLTLTHWFAKKGSPYIVLFHGNAGNIEDRAYSFKFLIDKGYSVLLVSYRGYGDNPGKPTEDHLISDSDLALQSLLKQEKISFKEVILIGESLGSGVAVALGAQYSVQGMILYGSFSSIADIGQAIYPLIPVRKLLKDTWDSQSRIQQVKAPIFFIHSKKDFIVPFRFAQKLFQQAPQPKKHLWMEHSGHNEILEAESVKQSIISFLQNL